MKIIDKKILLSFVLPIYNVEAYLQECVDSILAHITDECEIILVDDGSTDSSGDICQTYAQTSSLIKLVQKENGGLSSARNVGLSVAKGEYITFVDSDDKIYSESIPCILRWIKSEGTDICFLQAEKFYLNRASKNLGEGITRTQLRSQNRETAINHLTTRPKYPGSAWAKLYRREFLISNNLHFPYDRRYSEDLGFIRDCFLCANNFDALDIPYYQYRQSRNGSITNKITAKNFYDLLKFIYESSEKLTINGKSKDIFSKYLMRTVAYEYTILLHLYSIIPKADKKCAFIELKKFKWVLKYAFNTKVKVIAIICNFFGVRAASLLIKQYRKLSQV